MAGRSTAHTAYAVPQDSLEARNKFIAQDLRLRVRNLSNYTPMTPEWIDMIDTLEHISNIAAAEKRESGKGEGTVWERDELVMRYLIEERKVNMLLRSLVAFKAYQAKGWRDHTYDEVDTAHMARYERAMGVILLCLLSTTESLQTVDIMLVLEHLKAMFENTLTPSYHFPGDLQLQEFMAVQYLGCILRSLDKLTTNEEKVFRTIVDYRLLPLALEQYSQHSNQLSDAAKEAYCYAVAYLLEAELFPAFRSAIFDSSAVKQHLVSLRPIAVRLKSTETQDAAERRRLRTLCDLITLFA